MMRTHDMDDIGVTKHVICSFLFFAVICCICHWDEIKYVNAFIITINDAVRLSSTSPLTLKWPRSTAKSFNYGLFKPPSYIQLTLLRREKRHLLWLSATTSNPQLDNQNNNNNNSTQHSRPHMIVVGKIIIDEYGPPDQVSSPQITIGGGGPQAAMGAALALAALQYKQQKQQDLSSNTTLSDDRTSTPPPQPVTFMAPVGKVDFHTTLIKTLQETMQDALQHPPYLIFGKDCITPRIRLWHDMNQTVQWYAINDSFGNESGAGKLWKDYPTKQNYYDIIQKCTIDSNTTKTIVKPILHIIIEAGKNAPGNNQDSMPLLDLQIRQSISCMGIEPILFPNDDGHVNEADAIQCGHLLQNILNGPAKMDADVNDNNSTISVVISPDKPSYQAIKNMNCLPKSKSSSSILDSWAIREGPKGSSVETFVNSVSSNLEGVGQESKSKENHNRYDLSAMSQESNIIKVPAATLKQFVNPTGAGNAYAAAYTALKGFGCDTITSISIATGVGAVFCEYEHCPPYSYQVLDRILRASQEVSQKESDCPGL